MDEHSTSSANPVPVVSQPSTEANAAPSDAVATPLAPASVLSKEEQEEQMVNAAFDRLVQSYLASPHRKKVDIITKAFNFAKHAHKGVRRLSGEPYIMHPLAVAQIVSTEIGLGSTSICSALLHDVVEDTDYTVEDIENMFGPKIAQIVDGLTKISGGIFGDNASAQAENFKKLLLTMSEDIRVILIKIADRLHNMRTLGSQAKNKQYKIAGETLYIYAPLANRLGLNTIKNELENLSFRYEHPEEYDSIVEKLANTEAERNTVFEEFTRPIRDNLDAMGLHYDIKARIKTPYSIWRKMQLKHVAFEEIYDILAVRIIFDPKDPKAELNECFDIYVSLCKTYTSHPDRLRDWVSHPKATGYQALHVTLMSNHGEWIETQIRSRRMDDIAEKGFAAHWKYKQAQEGGAPSTDAERESELDKWLTTIKEILDDPQPDAVDLLDTIKLNLFASEVFVFTPKGDLRTLPAGSTVLDFAFTIHTFVGSHCLGAKVNHKLVPISHRLQSGDQVEILTSKSMGVQRSWLNIATTAKATTKILAVLRRQDREAKKKGEEILYAFFDKNELERNSVNIELLCEYHAQALPLSNVHVKRIDQFVIAIGDGTIQLGAEDLNVLHGKSEHSATGWKRIFSFGRKTSATPDATADKRKVDLTTINPKKPIVLSEKNLATRYTLAACCKPIPGDAVMGYIDDDQHVVVHRLQCPNAMRLKANHGNRVLAAEWSPTHNVLYAVSIYVEGIDHIGLLNEVTQVISQQFSVNMRHLVIDCSGGIFKATIDMSVHDTTETDRLIDSLKNINDIKSAVRL